MGRHQRANLNVKDTISREWSANAVLAIRLESMLGSGLKETKTEVTQGDQMVVVKFKLLITN